MDRLLTSRVNRRAGIAAALAVLGLRAPESLAKKKKRCKSGLTRCGSICVDLQTNPLHCGACFDECYEGQTCEQGTCRNGPQGECFTDANCQAGRGLICNTAVRCFREGFTTCCVVEGRGCREHCDCCGGLICTSGICTDPAGSTCNPNYPDNTVPCRGANVCCAWTHPFCCIPPGATRGICCPKTHPVCCGSGCCVDPDTESDSERADSPVSGEWPVESL